MTFNILVVEDEVDFCEVLVDLLRLKGYLATGIDSIRSYQAIQNPTEFDFIILDRTLPDGDGLCILEAHRKIANIPILILIDICTLPSSRPVAQCIWHLRQS